MSCVQFILKWVSLNKFRLGLLTTVPLWTPRKYCLRVKLTQLPSKIYFISVLSLGHDFAVQYKLALNSLYIPTHSWHLRSAGVIGGLQLSHKHLVGRSCQYPVDEEEAKLIFLSALCTGFNSVILQLPGPSDRTFLLPPVLYIRFQNLTATSCALSALEDKEFSVEFWTFACITVGIRTSVSTETSESPRREVKHPALT